MQNSNHDSIIAKAFLAAMAILALLAFAIIISAVVTAFQIPESNPSNLSLINNADQPDNPVTPSSEDITQDPQRGDSIDVGRVINAGNEDTETIDVLNKEDIPTNNPVELAGRIGGLSVTPIYKSDLPGQRSVGDMRSFWILDVDQNQYEQINAKLAYITPHLYFWVEDGVEVDPSEVAVLSETFENHIYPTDRSIFGSEWSPGVDHDVHLTILYAHGLGGAAGYFSSTDSLTSEIEPYSNENEMFYLSADYTTLDSEDSYGVLAHELQHMIHWNMDRNESAWVNEGLSELAVQLNGYDNGSFGLYFSINPDLQLNFWPGNDQGDSTPHYGASYLFMRYLMDRFGLDSIRQLVADKNVGLTSIDEVFGSKSADLENGYVSEKIFQEFSIANYVTGSVDFSSEQSIYNDSSDFPFFFPTETLACDSGWQDRIVNQFGSDYIAADCPGDFQVEVEGQNNVKLLPIDPYSGNYYFWSNYGDSSDMTLSQTFDLTEVQGTVSLNYWTWYDIERDYDYLYLLASTDGENWEMLTPDLCTTNDPTGSNYGCGYNGKSNGWINETVDLSQFSGSQVTIRFEYITDLAVNGDGFVIDDISINAIDYFSDFENGDGGWNGQGFVRIKNSLPQNYGFAFISQDDFSNPEKSIYIAGINLDETIEYEALNSNPVIVINGLTRFTHIPAEYRIRLTSLR